MKQTITREPWVALAEIFLIVILPVLLIQSGLVSSDNRILLYGVMYGLSIPLVIMHHLSLHDLNIRLDNFKQASRIFGVEAFILCLIGFVLIVIVQFRIEVGVSRSINQWQYVLVSIPIQQFVYFGFIHNRLTKITENKLLIVCAITILFGASHLPWNNTVFTLLSFVMGALLSGAHVIVPNVIWTFILHQIIGLLSLGIVQLR